jgi:hypothetical protein
VRLDVVLALVCLSAAAACGANDAAPAPANVAAMPPDAPSCRDGDEATQRHGTACLCCHSDEFGVGGSIDLAGPPVARVVITASDGDVADLAPDPFANFFRHFPLAPPLRAVVVGPDGRSVAMKELAPSGDCNVCHFAGGSAAPIVGP